MRYLQRSLAISSARFLRRSRNVRRFILRERLALLKCLAFHERLLLLGLVASLLLCPPSTGFSQKTSDQMPDWIWHSSQRQPGVTAFFRSELPKVKRVTSGIVRVAGESTSVELFINGRSVVSIGPYAPLTRRDVTEWLSPGKLVVGAKCTSYDGPSAFFMQLDLVFSDGSRQTVLTSPSWTTSQKSLPHWASQAVRPSDWNSATSFGPVDERLLIEESRRVVIGASDNYEQWKRAIGTEQSSRAASFMIAPGFEIERVRSAAPDEDSWVNLAFDPQGRAVIAKEKQGLLRMTLSDDGAQVVRVETINESLKECRGLLFAFGDLFVNANNSKALYRLQRRLRDDGTDTFDEGRILYSSSGGVGHGRNEIALGPDGLIYMIHGDAVDLPRGSTDYTSPFRDARRGKKTSEGHLLRINPDGGEVEVLAAGLRNPFGIDFNVDGEIFTYDADAEYDMGAPWYRPTRVSQIVIGGDYGWRGVTKVWPPYYPDHPDNARPGLDIGKGSPTAIKFGTDSNFPRRYQQALFILDWAYGRVIAVHLLKRGSSYLMSAETFLRGRPLNVTDLDFAPDGSMYLVTGGRGTQSTLYRVRYIGQNSDTQFGETQQQLDRREFAIRSHQRRLELEGLLQQRSDNERMRAWNQLADSDPWIRHAARNVIEQVPVASWQARALGETDLGTGIQALLALARSRSKEIAPRILQRLNELDWTTADRSDRLAAMYTYELALATDGDFDPQLLAGVASRLQAEYPSQTFQENQRLSSLLVELAADAALPETLDLLANSQHQTEQMHYLYVLRNVIAGASGEGLQTYFDVLRQANEFQGGAGMPTFLDQIRTAATAHLNPAQLADLRHLLDPVPATGSPDLPSPRSIVRQWSVDELTDRLDWKEQDRDLRRGKELFSTANCIRCHRMSGRGTPIGPDLTSVASRFGRRDLLEAIVEPSKVVPESYRRQQILTFDGKQFVGQTVPGGDYRSPVLRLRTDPLKPASILEIRKSEIEEVAPSTTSWMPDGLLDTLTREEIFDLLAYLENGRS